MAACESEGRTRKNRDWPHSGAVGRACAQKAGGVPTLVRYFIGTAATRHGNPGHRLEVDQKGSQTSDGLATGRPVRHSPSLCAARERRDLPCHAMYSSPQAGYAQRSDWPRSPLGERPGESRSSSSGFLVGLLRARRDRPTGQSAPGRNADQRAGRRSSERSVAPAACCTTPTNHRPTDRERRPPPRPTAPPAADPARADPAVGEERDVTDKFVPPGGGSAKLGSRATGAIHRHALYGEQAIGLSWSSDRGYQRDATRGGGCCLSGDQGRRRLDGEAQALGRNDAQGAAFSGQVTRSATCSSRRARPRAGGGEP